jgi:hypothetical protein
VIQVVIDQSYSLTPQGPIRTKSPPQIIGPTAPWTDYWTDFESENGLNILPKGLYSVEFSVNVSGSPDPDMRWYKVTKEGTEVRIMDDYKHDIEVINSRGPYLAVGEAWMILRIRQLQMGDFGNYSCKALNTFGQRADYINLFGKAK